MPYAEIGRGFNDLSVAPVTGAADTAGTAVDYPGARTLDFGVDSDQDQLEGDDTIIAIARGTKTGSGSLELGRNNPEALAVITGSTVTTSGTSPNEIKTVEEPATNDTIFFQIIGLARSADVAGSAYQVTIHKALLTSGLNESLSQNGWNTPTGDFAFVKNASNKFLTRKWYEDIDDVTP